MTNMKKVEADNHSNDQSLIKFAKDIDPTSKTTIMSETMTRFDMSNNARVLVCKTSKRLSIGVTQTMFGMHKDITSFGVDISDNIIKERTVRSIVKDYIRYASKLEAHPQHNIILNK